MQLKLHYLSRRVRLRCILVLRFKNLLVVEDNDFLEVLEIADAGDLSVPPDLRHLNLFQVLVAKMAPVLPDDLSGLFHD